MGTSQEALVVKNPPANAGDIRDMGSIPESGRSPGGGESHSRIFAWEVPWREEPAKLHYSAWVTESQTGLKQLSMQHVQNIYKAIQKSFAFLTIPI